jgi:hypothetical protein
MARKARELFEILSSREQQENWPPATQAKLAALPDPDEAARRAGIGGRRMAFTVNHAILLIGVLVVSNVASYLAGRTAASGGGWSLRSDPPGARRVYSLRVWRDIFTSDKLDQAKRVANELETAGFPDVKVYKISGGKMLAIDLGRWTSPQAPELVEVDRRIRELRDANRKQRFPEPVVVHE